MILNSFLIDFTRMKVPLVEETLIFLPLYNNEDVNY